MRAEWFLPTQKLAAGAWRETAFEVTAGKGRTGRSAFTELVMHPRRGAPWHFTIRQDALDTLIAVLEQARVELARRARQQGMEAP